MSAPGVGHHGHASNASGSHAEVTKHADTTKYTTQKSFKTDRRDKPKHSGKEGATSGPKKGGGGGKGTWGRPGDESKLQDGLDPKDPNYASDEDAQVPPTPSSDWTFEPTSDERLKFATSLDDLARFKQTVKSACQEYVSSNDAAEFTRILNAIGMSVYHQDLPYILIKYSLDLSDDERVRVSNLLGYLSRHGSITPQQMGAGVRKLYNSLHDLLVDAPKARIQLREHVQFAVAGGFLDAALSKQLEAEQDALSDEKQVAADKAKIDSIITEFFASEDLPDAVSSLKELKAPHLAFEVVKRLILRSMDMKHRQREGASVFLADQNGQLLTTADIEKGFTVLLERADDIALDVPNALQYLSLFVARAVVDEVLPPAFLMRVDLAGGDAGTQVLRQAQTMLKQQDASDRLAYVWEELAEREDNAKKA